MADQPAQGAPAGGATPDQGAAPSTTAANGAPASPASQSTTNGASSPTTSAPTSGQPAKPSTQERLAAAKAKVAGSTPASGSAATPSPSAQASSAAAPAASADKPTDSSKPSEPSAEAKPDKPPAGAWGELADREAALTESQRALKAERDAFKTEQQAHGTRTARYTKAEELAGEGDHLGALAALGIDLEKAQDQFLASQRDKTPEEIAREAARAELAEVERQREEQRKADEKKTETERNEAGQAAVKAWCTGVQDEIGKLGAKWTETFPTLAAHEVYDSATGKFRRLTDIDVYNRAVAIEIEASAAEKRQAVMPTPLEALQRVEADLAKRFKPAQPAAPTGGDKQETTAGDRAPTTLPPDGGGSVPLRKPQAKKESALDRLQRAKQARGVH